MPRNYLTKRDRQPGRGGPRGYSLPYGTGPHQSMRLPGQLGPEPSIESLTEARFNQFEQGIGRFGSEIDAFKEKAEKELRNTGAASRLEDAKASAMATYGQRLAAAGRDTRSFGGAQAAAGGEIDAMDRAFGREAEIASDLAKARVGAAGQATGFRGQQSGQYGSLAGMQQDRANSVFQQWLAQRQLKMAEDDAKYRRIAMLRSMLGGGG